MRIERPTNYYVSFSEEEEEIIRNCIGVLENVKNELINHHCEHLEWTDTNESINLTTIEGIIDDLDTLTYVDTMF